MSVLNSWCERICLLSLLLGVSILLADYKFDLLPIHGLWLVLYVVVVIVCTIWIICVDIQKLLQRNTPFEYDFESNKQYQRLLGVYRFISSKVGVKTSAALDLNVNDEPQTPAEELRAILDAMPVVLPVEIDDQNAENSIDDRINVLVSDIELKFISKWYNLISDDENFPAEAKILLEGVVRRILQVSVQLDSGKILRGALVILLKHLKEYRRSVKRVAKSGGCVEAVYRYGHMGNKSSTGLAHFTHQLTGNVLREFISWELWTSLPCRLLVAILSKKLTSYIIYYISQPGWLNYKMIESAASKNEKTILKLDDYEYVSLSDVDLSGGMFGVAEITLKEALDSPMSCTPKMSPKREMNALKFEEEKSGDAILAESSDSVIENALTKMIAQQTAPILQRAEKSASETVCLPQLDLDIQTPYKRSQPVKIHAAKSSTKRWDDNELANLSLGQDLLALEALEGSGIHNFSGRRLWGFNADLEGDADKQTSWESGDSWSKDKEVDDANGKRKDCSRQASSPPSISSIPHCLRPATTSASAFVTNTIRPIAGNVTATTLHNMRELQQSTVNNVVRPVHHVTEKAIHKIGDLQDEAVGVVEGIFDFGMAGIRKGLRLTGLQETELQKTAKLHSSTSQQPDVVIKDSPKPGPKLAKLSHVTSEDVKVVRPPEENCWINPLAKESPNGFENQMLLVSQETSPNLIEGEATVAENPLVDITEAIFLTDSPEYEETADLASTISKLRSLLQQKSSESSLNTPAVSPMPFEDKPCLTPVELPCVMDGAVRPPGINNQDGGMQRFARTVTGMFNTFKTALPGNMNDQSQTKEEQWLFVENESSDTDLASLLNSLLVERRDYCTVDTAYEAMDTLDLLTESISSTKIQWENNLFVDELDELDSSIPITKALLDVVCECLQGTRCALNQEPVVQALLLLAGVKSEETLTKFAEKLLRGINRLVGALPKTTTDNVLPMDLEHLESIIEASFPYYIREIFGHEDLKTALNFFISSLQSVKINQDITLQLFELICSQLIYTSGQISPTPSA